MNNIQHIPISSVPQPLLRAIDELWTDAFNWQPVPNDEEVEAAPEASLFLLRSDNVERFREEAEDGTLTPHPDGEEDVIYVNERANLIQTILRKPTCWAYIPEFW